MFVPDSFAQDDEWYTNYIVYEEVIAPADVPYYAEIQNKHTELFKKHGFTIPMLSYRTDEFSYYWVIPIKNFASLDDLYKSFNEFHAKLMEDEEFDSDALNDKYTQNQFIIHHSESLSYNPEGGGQNENNTYCEWTYVYLKSGHGKAAAEAIKKYKEFYDGIEETYQWDVFNVVIGPETPCWIFMTRAESEMALRKLETEMSEKYGEDFKKMWGEFIPHVRKMENLKGWFIPKWSLNWK